VSFFALHRQSPSRALLCWTAFLVPAFFELHIHIVSGVSRDVFEREEICSFSTCSRQWKEFLEISELICRVCLAILLAGYSWELARAVVHDNVCRWVRDSFHADTSRSFMCAVVLSLFTFIVGVWGVAVDDDGLPLWALVYSHCADCFCHSIIASSIMGFCFDSLVAAKEGWLKSFICQFLTCLDTIEAHGVSSHDSPGELFNLQSFLHSDEQQAQRHRRRRLWMKRARLVYMWFVFIFIFYAYTINTYTPDDAPKWMGIIVELLGRLCWTGIAWWLMISIGSGQRLLLQRLWRFDRCDECGHTDVGLAGGPDRSSLNCSEFASWSDLAPAASGPAASSCRHGGTGPCRQQQQQPSRQGGCQDFSCHDAAQSKRAADCGFPGCTWGPDAGATRQQQQPSREGVCRDPSCPEAAQSRGGPACSEPSCALDVTAGATRQQQRQQSCQDFSCHDAAKARMAPACEEPSCALGHNAGTSRPPPSSQGRSQDPACPTATPNRGGARESGVCLDRCCPLAAGSEGRGRA